MDVDALQWNIDESRAVSVGPVDIDLIIIGARCVIFPWLNPEAIVIRDDSVRGKTSSSKKTITSPLNM